MRALEALRRHAARKLARLQSMKLANQLTIPFSLLIACISLVVFIYLPAQYEQQAMRTVSNKSASIVSIASFGAGPAMLFGDSTNIHETIESLRQDPQVSFVVFLDTEGRIAASYKSPEAERAGFRAARHGDHRSADGKYYIDYAPVKVENRPVGELYLGISLVPMREDIARTRMAVAASSVVFFILGVFIAYGISLFATKPLAQMVRTAKAISAGDFSSRTEVRSDNEVGHLASAFNTMIDRLHSAYLELEANNENLEREVQIRQQSEIALRDSERILLNSQKISHLGSYVFDIPSMRWKSSKNLDEILGIGDDFDRTVEGYVSLIHADFRVEVMNAVRNAVIHHDRFDIKYIIRRPSDGVERWVRGVGEFESDDPGCSRMLGTVQDISESIRLEQQLRQAKKMESLGTLAGGIAHDFNNLLLMILGSAELVRAHLRGNDAIQKHVSRIIEASERGASISRQLLIFTRPEDSEKKPVSVSAVIADLQQMLTHSLPKTVAIETNMRSDNAVLFGDTGQIHQALLNLALNASDAMNGSGTLTFDIATVSASSLPKKFDHVTASYYSAVSITDTGEGMSETTIEKIFDPFFTTKPKGKGTGLGLAIVHGIMTHHHGYIDVESTPGVGTTFTLYFPIAQGVTLPPEEHETDGFEQQAGTILIVDDELMIRDMLTDYLEECGYTVLKAENGVEGLREYIAHRQSIDLVISDLGMPEMDGEELFRQLKLVDPAVRVLISSGYLDGTSREQLLKMGVIDVLTKPYRFQQISTIVQATVKGLHSDAAPV